MTEAEARKVWTDAKSAYQMAVSTHSDGKVISKAWNDIIAAKRALDAIISKATTNRFPGVFGQ